MRNTRSLALFGLMALGLASLCGCAAHESPGRFLIRELRPYVVQTSPEAAKPQPGNASSLDESSAKVQLSRR